MARKRNQGIDIDPKSKTISEIIEMDLGHMKGLSQSSLARLTSRLVSAYNKRAKRLEQSGMAQYSPAYQGIAKENKTRLSVKGKTWNELIKTLSDAKRFLSERVTSSVTGAKKVRREMEKRIGHSFRSHEESQRYWEAVDKLKEKGFGTDKRTSTDIQREVADMMLDDGKSVWVHEGCFDILNENGERLFDPPLRISEFSRHPRAYFNLIAEKIKTI